MYKIYINNKQYDFRQALHLIKDYIKYNISDVYNHFSDSDYVSNMSFKIAKEQKEHMEKEHRCPEEDINTTYYKLIYLMEYRESLYEKLVDKYLMDDLNYYFIHSGYIEYYVKNKFIILRYNKYTYTNEEFVIAISYCPSGDKLLQKYLQQ